MYFSSFCKNFITKVKDKRLFFIYKIALLDIHIIRQILPRLIFYIIVCSITGEVIGISFEQAKLAIEQELPLSIVVHIHLLKLPYFIYLALPFSLLIATIGAYTELSSKNETIAMQSFGISLYRQIIPALFIGEHPISATIFFRSTINYRLHPLIHHVSSKMGCSHSLLV